MNEEVLKKLNRLERLLFAQKSVLSFSDLLIYTGMSASMVYKLTSRRLIPFSKPTGGRLYFEKSKIDKWLLQNPQLSDREVEEEVDQQLANSFRVKF